MGLFRIFIDTEFTNLSDIGLISIALVSDEGDEFYRVVNDFDREECGDFTKQYVLPQLMDEPGAMMPRAQLRGELRAWLEQFKDRRPCLCYDDFADFALYRELVEADVPPWLMSENIWQKIDAERRQQFWSESGLQEHHALNDAKANRVSYRVPGDSSGGPLQAHN